MEKTMYRKRKGICLILATVMMITLAVFHPGTVFAEEMDTPSVESFLTEIAESADVVQPTDYPLSVGAYDGENWLKFYTNGSSYKRCTLKLTMKEAATVSFDYQLDTGSGSGLEVKIGYTTYYTYSSYGSNAVTSVNGTKSGTAAVQVNAGETLDISFYRGYYSPSSGQGDCMYVKNLKASLPQQVTFHANNGTDENKSQGIFTTSNLVENTFTYDKHRFLGWAASEERAAEGTVDYEDGASFTIEEDTDLYAVWETLCAIDFDVKTEGADFALYEDAEHTTAVQPTSGTSYVVDAGTYYWICEAFGHRGQSGEVTASEQDVFEEITLEQNPQYTVKFVFDQDAGDIAKQKIVLKTGERTMIAEETDGVVTYQIPVGYAYDYKFSSSNYMSQKDSFDLTDTAEAGEKTITISLISKDAWEGGDDIEEPECVDNVYQIETGANLAWLAQEVNSGNGVNYNAVLVKNINLGGQSWTPIGQKSYGKSYMGTFDGNGKTVTGLFIQASSQDQGLFGYVSGGTVKNVTVEGSVSSEGVTNSDGTAGVVGTLCSTYSSTASVTECVNKASVTGENNVGGVVGCAAGSYASVVSECTNYGDVTANNSAGGIIGRIYGPCGLTNSYNRGSTEAKVSKAAGIVAYIDASKDFEVYNCYTTGTAAAPQDFGATIGKVDSSYGTKTLKKLYYLASDNIEDTYGIAKTEEELKNLAEVLNLNADQTIWQNGAADYNDGYPVFATESVPVDVSALQEAISAMEDYIATLTKDSQSQQKETLQKALEEAKTVLTAETAKQTDVDNAVAALSESKSAAAEAQEIADRIAEVEEKLAEANKALEESRKAGAETEGKLTDTQEKLTETEGKLAEAEEKLAETNDALEEVKGALEEANTSADSLDEKVKALEEKVASLEADLAFQKRSPKSLKAAVSGKKVTLSWKKVKDAASYKVYYSTKKNGKYKLLKTVKSGKTKFVSKKMKKGTYYFKVRAYNENKLSSKLSAAKKVRIK